MKTATEALDELDAAVTGLSRLQLAQAIQGQNDPAALAGWIKWEIIPRLEAAIWVWSRNCDAALLLKDHQAARDSGAAVWSLIVELGVAQRDVAELRREAA